ncbi:MAG TPA: choice-of-anchor Q domain-containing protein [Acidimicrobiales bacterium]|nr:choice-of-anchor Q domain-containing protein [Acidimicrobiales bacterium]
MAGALLTSVALPGPAADALTILTVTSTADTNTPGTLRFALTTADATNDDVEIDVQAGLLGIPLTAALPSYTGGGGNHSLTIDGGGVTVYGQSSSDVLVSTSSGSLTVSQMTVTGGADGIHDSGGDVTVINATISGNQGSGILTAAGDVSLVYATVVDNAPSGSPDANVRTAGGDLSSFGSVMAFTQDGAPDCSVGGSTTSHGFNASDDASCGFTAPGDLENRVPPLDFSTSCHLSACTQYWVPGSPLVDAIPIAQCQADGAAGITVDEIGTSRPQGSGCDIGAIELEPALPNCLCPAQHPYGYSLVGADGGVFTFGDASFVGSLPELGIHVHDIVGITTVAAGNGYWLADTNGGVFAFGSAQFEGSLPALGIDVHDIVGIVSTLDGRGYWLVGADGGVFAFGDATYDGSLPARGIVAKNIVGIAQDYSGDYSLAGANGSVFTFGPDGFAGWPGFSSLSRPVTGIENGYLVGADGGVFSLGNAPFDGSLPADHISPLRPVVGIARSGIAYWLTSSDGAVFALGGVPYLGGMSGSALAAPVVGITSG